VNISEAASYLEPTKKSNFGMQIKNNNFDLLRFLLAIIVFLVHASTLSNVDALSIINKFFSSESAVKAFFVVSGFLIFMSYENSKDIKQYFSKRIRRVYPAYFSIVVLSAVIGCFFSTYTLSDYISFVLFKYLAANLVFLNFLQPNLPGLFENNTLHAVNGALWTLKIEVMFYLFVPLAVMSFRKYGRFYVMLLLYILSILYSFSMSEMARRTGHDFYLELQRQLPGQIAFFMAGAMGYYYFPQLVKYKKWLIAISLFSFVFQLWLPWIVVQPIALGILVISFACFFPYIGNFGKFGDFSYGIYVVHFPVIQLLIAFGLFNQSPWIAICFAGLLVISVAVSFWHFIEKPFLQKSYHYVAASNE
jgi:peptidoglycan/LPS O-acetylase OafA/YrhL